jgi:hypothetical protein
MPGAGSRREGGETEMTGPIHNPRPTIHVVWFLAAALGGCGVDSATTAATGAAIKKEEVEQGRKTMGQAQQKVEQAAQRMQERAQRDSDTTARQ